MRGVLSDLLNSAAEQMKRAIYEFRSHTGAYSSGNERDLVLATRIKSISGSLRNSDAMWSNLTHGPSSVEWWLYNADNREDFLDITAKGDDGLKMFDAQLDTYIECRLTTKMAEFMNEAGRLSHGEFLFQCCGCFCTW